MTQHISHTSGQSQPTWSRFGKLLGCVSGAIPHTTVSPTLNPITMMNVSNHNNESPRRTSPRDDESVFSHASSECTITWDDLQINSAIHVLLTGGKGTPRSAMSSCNLEVLSVSDRGVTLTGWNSNLDKRTVIRVSPFHRFKSHVRHTAATLGGSEQAAHRILLFGQSMYERSQPPPVGIVPFVSQPTVLKDCFLVEQYEEVVSESFGRLDLHTFISKRLDGEDARRTFGYLHDVLTGIIEMHRRGWAHLDLSLENIVLTDDRAFIIDFESVLPFATQKDGAIRREDLRVPLKAPFVPPEYLIARRGDLLSLPSFDVWAFGVMFFSVLFRQYFFASRWEENQRGGKRLVPDEIQIAYFLEHGFWKFCERFHPEKYALLFCGERGGKKCGKNMSSYLHACGDLLSKIFVPACEIPLMKKNGGGKSHDCVSRSDLKKEEGVSVYFCDCARVTAQDVFEHPFWEEYHIRE